MNRPQSPSPEVNSKTDTFYVQDRAAADLVEFNLTKDDQRAVQAIRMFTRSGTSTAK
jgi:hypothetical protein